MRPERIGATGIRQRRNRSGRASRPRGFVRSSAVTSTRTRLPRPEHGAAMGGLELKGPQRQATLRAIVVTKALKRGRSVRDALPRRSGGPFLHAAQVVEGGDQLLVLRRIGRHVGRRAALLVLVVLEVAAQPGLALGLVLALELVRDLLQDLDVGLDALGLDRAAGRGVVARRRQPDGAVAAERDDGLDGALAEGLGARAPFRACGPGGRRRRSRTPRRSRR